MGALSKMFDVKDAVTDARYIYTSSKFYISCTQIVMNLVVKPAKKVPQEVIKASIRSLLLGLSVQGYWRAAPANQSGESPNDMDVDGAEAAEQPKYQPDFICKDPNVDHFGLVCLGTPGSRLLKSRNAKAL